MKDQRFMAEQLAQHLAGSGEEPPKVDAPPTQPETVEPQDASRFYDFSPETVAIRACHELVRRGVKPYDLFGIFADALMPLMNELTRAEACKPRATQAKSKANAADKEKAA